MRAATMLAAVNAFKETGLYPVNRNIFTDADFCPSSTTERLRQPTSSQSLDTDVQQAPSSDAEVQQVQPVQSSDAEVQQAQCSMLEALSTPRHAVLCQPKRLLPLSSISPLPVCQKQTIAGKRRARGETVVLTSSLYKAKLHGTKSQNKNGCKETQKRKRLNCK